MNDNFNAIKISKDRRKKFSNDSPKKVLYFSDGTLEVDDDTEEIPYEESESKQFPVNPQELTWFPWMWYQTVTAGSKALEVCDYVGESLASFFGITTPKYQFEINEYLKIRKAEEETKNEIEMGNWSPKTDSDLVIKDLEPSPKILYLNNENDSNFS